MRLGEELIGVLGVDPDDQAPLLAGRHRHVAADKKDETAEHALLADIGLSRDQLTNPVGEILVVRHARIIIFERQVPWPLLARVRPRRPGPRPAARPRSRFDDPYELRRHLVARESSYAVLALAHWFFNDSLPAARPSKLDVDFDFIAASQQSER
jgi:hypothetical protein